MDATSTPGHLTGIVDAAGTRFATFKYDARGRGIFTEHANGVQRFTVTYNPTGTAVVTTPLGAVQTLSFVSSLSIERLASSVLSCPAGGCSGAGSASPVYDANGNTTEFPQPNGFKTCAAYEPLRNLPWKVLTGVPGTQPCDSALAAPPASARLTTYEWHPQFRAPVLVQQPGVHTSLQYDSAGRVLSLTTQSPDGTQARTTAFTYNSAGQVLTVDGPRTDVADVTTYSYGASGNLASITDPVGNVTTFTTYTGDGRLLTGTLPNGASFTAQYNLRGQPTSISVAGLATTFGYNTRGLLATESRPDGSVLTYGYDAAHRLTSVTDQRGNSRNLVLNAAGGALQDTLVAAGGVAVVQTNQTFDELNRTLQQTGAHVNNPTAVLLY